MKLYHVVAMANGRVIGKDNKLPWHFSADLKFFKQLTTGSTMIMGRRTYESIGKPLPYRENFVLSRDPCLPKRGLKTTQTLPQFFPSLEDAIQHVRTEKAFIMGGQNLYQQTLDQIDGIYLTRIHADFEGDAFYPEIPPAFKEISRTPLQENPKIEVMVYEKR